MIKLYTVLLASLISTTMFAQVGINTEDPQATLDVNGDMRIRQTEDMSEPTHVLTADTDGFVKKVAIEDLGIGAVNMEEAMFVPGQADISSRTPVLDLWSEQETNDLQGIKRYYFIGQSASVTLPKNISKIGDGTARVITFILVRNDEFGAPAINDWNFAVQTKLYQENASTFNGTNGGVFLYDSYFGGSDLNLLNSASDTAGDGYNRRISLSGQDRIRDREINFYDFGGKWIMTVND